MDFSLTEEHIMIRDAARDFAQTELLPGVIERDNAQTFPDELVKKMGYTGIKSLESDMPQYKIFNPANIRSRFAAFDPFRKHEADILAGVGIGGMLDPESVSEEFRKKERK